MTSKASETMETTVVADQVSSPEQTAPPPPSPVAGEKRSLDVMETSADLVTQPPPPKRLKDILEAELINKLPKSDDMITLNERKSDIMKGLLTNSLEFIESSDLSDAIKDNPKLAEHVNGFLKKVTEATKQAQDVDTQGQKFTNQLVHAAATYASSEADAIATRAAERQALFDQTNTLLGLLAGGVDPAVQKRVQTMLEDHPNATANDYFKCIAPTVTKASANLSGVVITPDDVNRMIGYARRRQAKTQLQSAPVASSVEVMEIESSPIVSAASQSLTAAGQPATSSVPSSSSSISPEFNGILTDIKSLINEVRNQETVPSYEKVLRSKAAAEQQLYGNALMKQIVRDPQQIVQMPGQTMTVPASMSPVGTLPQTFAQRQSAKEDALDTSAVMLNEMTAIKAQLKQMLESQRPEPRLTEAASSSLVNDTRSFVEKAQSPEFKKMMATTASTFSSRASSSLSGVGTHQTKKLASLLSLDSFSNNVTAVGPSRNEAI